MKLKKILSLISALAIAASSFTTVALAREPHDSTIAFEVVPVDVTDTIKTSLQLPYKNTYDKTAQGYKTYLITVKAKGLDYTAYYDAENYFGHGRYLTGYQINIVPETTGTLTDDYKLELYSKDTGFASPSKTDLLPTEYLTALATAEKMYPTEDEIYEDEDNTMNVTEVDLTNFVMYVNPEKPVTLKVSGDVSTNGFESSAGAAMANTDGIHTAPVTSITLPPVTAAVTGVEITPDGTTLTKGTKDSEELTANVTVTGTPTYEVDWTIETGSEYVTLGTPSGDNKENVTVSIKPDADLSAARTATIKATAATGVTDTITVTIAAVAQNPTGITLNKDTTTLLRGATETLEATIAPPNAQGTIVWSSSDDTVATVSQAGLVTAKKKGTATITAKIEGTDFSDSCEVTVNNPAISILFKNRGEADANKWFYEDPNGTGYVWKVEVANRYENQPLEATFSSGSLTPITRLLPLNLVEMNDAFRFDIVLNTDKQNVTLRVDVPQAN